MTARPEFIADPQPEAVQGTDVESRAAVDVRAALPHFGGRLVVVRQRRDRGRVHAAFGDEVPETLGQHPGLSRAGGGDHPSRTGAVVDRRELVGSQIGGCVNPAGRSQPSRLRVPPMDHLDPRSEFRRLWWTPVDEDRSPVGHDDVARWPAGPLRSAPGSAGSRLGVGHGFTNTLVGTEPGRLAAVPPDGNAAPGVVIVGPDQELQALAAELEMRGQLVDGAPAVLGRPQCRRGHCQFDDDRAASEPVAVELLRHRSRVLQRGVVNDDPGA